jgi:hypothetical protein
MAKCRKRHLLFFLLIFISMQCILPAIGYPGNYLPLPGSPPDDFNLTGSRAYCAASSENYNDIIDVGNLVFHRSSWEPHVGGTGPFDLEAPSHARKHLGKPSPRGHTPPMVQNISPPPSLKATVSTSITPLVLFSEFLLMTTVTDKIVYLLFMLCYSLCVFSWLVKKHPDV